jgi:hypothetical protein
MCASCVHLPLPEVAGAFALCSILVWRCTPRFVSAVCQTPSFVCVCVVLARDQETPCASTQRSMASRHSRGLALAASLLLVHCDCRRAAAAACSGPYKRLLLCAHMHVPDSSILCAHPCYPHQLDYRRVLVAAGHITEAEQL